MMFVYAATADEGRKNQNSAGLDLPTRTSYMCVDTFTSTLPVSAEASDGIFLHVLITLYSGAIFRNNVTVVGPFFQLLQCLSCFYFRASDWPMCPGIT